MRLRELPRDVWSRARRFSAELGVFGRLQAVKIELGEGEAWIQAVAYADGRVRLAFGSGEEFVGHRQDLPARVGSAARALLEAARPLVGLLPRQALDDPGCVGSVKFELQTDSAVYAQGARVAELREGRSCLTPVWNGFGQLIEPMLVALFRQPVDPDIAAQESPGLARARSLWSRS